MDQEQPDPETAQASIATLKADAAWMASYHSGDGAKVSEMTRLFEAAYPEPAEDAAPPKAEEPKAAPTLQADESAPMADAPRGPWEYETPLFEGSYATDENLAIETGIKEALYKAELPPFVWNRAHMLVMHNFKEGISGDHERIAAGRTACLAELDRRNGANAKQIIADASKVVNRLDDASLDIGDILANSGALVDADFIETLARVQRDYYEKRAAK